MNRKLIIRISLDILIAIAVLNAWWFVALPLAAIGIRYFGYFAEAVIAGVVYDALFGMTPGSGPWSYAGTIISAVLFATVGGLKRVVR